METRFEDSFEDYINLYEMSKPIKELSPLKNQTYKVFSESDYDIRVFDRRECFEKLSYLSKIAHFIEGSGDFFYILPIQTVKGSLVGFIYRKVLSSDYASIIKNSIELPINSEFVKVPTMFGFRDFNRYDEAKQLPIVVCEGIKDALVLKKIYPFVLSNNTNRMGLSSYVLRNITHRFLISYDNDEAGNEGYESDKETLNRTGAYAVRLKIPSQYKDIADWYFDKGIYPIRDELVNKINYLRMN